jgi:hypothetical protein
MKVYNIVDGGVYSNFPDYLVTRNNNITTGYKFANSERIEESDTRFDFIGSMKILKLLIMSMLDIGISKKHFDKIYVGEIVCPQVTTLDFDMTDEKKQYLVDSGEKAANTVFKKINSIA